MSLQQHHLHSDATKSMKSNTFKQGILNIYAIDFRELCNLIHSSENIGQVVSCIAIHTLSLSLTLKTCACTSQFLAQ